MVVLGDEVDSTIELVGAELGSDVASFEAISR